MGSCWNRGKKLKRVTLEINGEKPSMDWNVETLDLPQEGVNGRWKNEKNEKRGKKRRVKSRVKEKNRDILWSIKIYMRKAPGGSSGTWSHGLWLEKNRAK